MSKQSVLAMAALLIGACAPANSNKGGGMDTASMASDKAAVDAVRSRYEVAFKAGDAAAIAALHTSDGMSMSDMQPTATGTDAITKSQQAFFDQYTVVDASIKAEKTEISGNVAFDVGTYKFTAIGKAKKDTLKAEGRYMVGMHKQADGSWKAVVDIDNTSAPPPMPAAPPPAKKKM